MSSKFFHPILAEEVRFTYTYSYNSSLDSLKKNELSKQRGLKLYQTIYHGVQKGAEQLTQTILTSKESDLEPTQLASARRVSAVHLPWKKEEASWSCAGEIAPGENVVVSVKTDYNDQSSNPFLHTYHPDHDNLDAKFKNELNQGNESWGINREMPTHTQIL